MQRLKTPPDPNHTKPNVIQTLQNKPPDATHNVPPLESFVWTCKICNVSMFMASVESHLAGKMHSTRAKSSEQMATPMIPRPIPRKPKEVKWTCTTCNMTMGSSAKDSHLAGRKHTAREKGVAQRKVEVRRVLTTTWDPPPKVKPKQKMWFCVSCSKTMGIESKASHINGKKHETRVATVQTGLGVPFFPSPSIDNPIKFHLAGKIHARRMGASVAWRDAAMEDKNAGFATEDPPSIYPRAKSTVQKTWTCFVCSKSMGLGLKMNHIRGSSHKKQRRYKNRVGHR